MHARLGLLTAPPDLVPLDQVHLAPFRCRHGIHPRGSFPPGGDDHIGIRHICRRDRPAAFEHTVGQTRERNVTGLAACALFALQRTPATMTQGAQMLPQGGRCIRTADHRDLVPPRLQLPGVIHHDAIAPGQQVVRHKKGNAHGCDSFRKVRGSRPCRSASRPQGRRANRSASLVRSASPAGHARA